MRHKRVSDSTNLERKHGGFELVGEAEEARLMAAVNKCPNKLAWRRRRTCERGRPCGTEVLTPFGLVEVWDIGGFAVLRNDGPLYHSTCRTGRFGGDNARRASIFLSNAAAQAAAELHLALGWGDYAREPDCLAFDWDDDNLVCLDGPPPRREPTLTRPPHAAAVDDDHVFKGWELLDRSEPWGYLFWQARTEQVRLIKHVPHPRVQRDLWRDFAGQPAWRRAAQGWFSLKTPYGELVVRRVNNAGWIAERNGRALCYGRGAANLANLKVAFNDYKDAQTLALLWVFPWRVLLSSLPSCGYRLLKDDILHWSDGLPAVAAA